MKTGDKQRSETTARRIPSPWAGATIGAVIALVLTIPFGLMAVVAGVLLAAIIGGVGEVYYHRFDAWRPDSTPRKPWRADNWVVGFYAALVVIVAVVIGITRL